MFAGYSATTPSLWSMMGYDAMVIRFEGPDDMRNQWGDEKAFEFLWEGGKTLSSARARILTHVMRWNYGDMLSSSCYGNCPPSRHPSPVNFEFDKLKLHNASDVHAYARALVDWGRKYVTVYQGPQLAVWGSDFQFTQAGMWFSQMDQIIAEVNANPARYGNATVRYTTLAGYFDHLNALNLSFPVKTNTSFEFGWPHAWRMQTTGNVSVQHQTGAPASQAAHKQNVRRSAELTRAAQVAHAVGLAAKKLPASLADQLQVAWDANGVCQHHDSVTGTMMNARSFAGVASPSPIVDLADSAAVERCGTTPNCRVLEDYTARLAEGRAASASVLATSLRALSGAANLTLDPTDRTGTLLLYNPLAHDRKTIVEVPFVRGKGVNGWPTVLDHTGAAVLAQLAPNDEVLTLGTPTRPFKDVVYFTASVPALGFATFTLRFDHPAGSSTVAPTVVAGTPDAISNGLITVRFDRQTGLMRSVSPNMTGDEINMTQTYYEYIDGEGGAYCLIMTGKARAVSQPYNVSHAVGPLFSQVTQSFRTNGGMQQWVRLFKGADVIEVEHHVGRLAGGREVVSRLHTGIANNGGLSTDDSGFPEMHVRPLNRSAPIAQNFHALVQSASIGDGARQLSVLTRRTMAAASQANGDLEYMLARRLIDGNDNQGPYPLDEQDDIRDTIWLAVGAPSDVEEIRMPRALELEHSLIPLWAEGTTPPPTPWLAPIAPLPSHVWLDLFVRHSTVAAGAPEYAVRLYVDNVWLGFATLGRAIFSRVCLARRNAVSSPEPAYP